MLIAGTLESAYSIDVGDYILTNLKFNGLETVKIQFRSLVRATIEKFPYYWFSDFSFVRSNLTYLVSEPQY